MIEFDDVTKTYADGTTAVDHLSLRVETGAITVFVGPSGCGKTTSMRMINRMITPTSGAVRVDGRDIADLDVVKLRRGIGYVIQSAGLLPHRTVLDNVATVPVLNGVSRRAARAAAEVLERVGLDPSLGSRYPAQLSGGQQQRVGVARALAADPPILLMDEPFSAVDPVVRADLQAELQRLQAELHKTVVFVTHDIDEAVKLGDRVAVFGRGGVLQQYDEPQRPARRPGDRFRRGLRRSRPRLPRLSFRSADEVPLHDLPTATPAGLADLDLSPGQWVLVIDESGVPKGWIDAAGVARFRTGADVAAATAAGGSLFRVGGDLRQALDAAISSPSGVGVAVNGDGAVAGGIDPESVLKALAEQRAAEQRASKNRAADEQTPRDGP